MNNAACENTLNLLTCLIYSRKRDIEQGKIPLIHFSHRFILED